MSTKKSGQFAATNLNRCKVKKTTRHSNTKSESFAASEKLRETQKRKTLKWFAEHPTEAKCDRDICEIMGFPINCTTRTVYELLDEGRLEHAFDAVSRHSNRKVRHVRFKPVFVQLEIPFPND